MKKAAAKKAAAKKSGADAKPSRTAPDAGDSGNGAEPAAGKRPRARKTARGAAE